MSDTMEYGSRNLLQDAVSRGIINLQGVQTEIEMIKRKELLEKHPYKIWKGSDGNWHTYLPDKDKGRIPKKRTTKSSLEDMIADFWKTESENPTVEEVFNEWNDRKLNLKKISNSTHLRYTQVFQRHYREFGKYRIKNIDPEEFEEFLEEQIAEYELSAKAFSNLKSITRGFLKRAKKRKLISYNVEELFGDLDVSDVDFKKIIKEDYQEVFDEEEMDKMIPYLIDHLDTQNLGILLMFISGIRVGELVTLKHSDFTEISFNIRRTETRYKNNEGKYVYEVKEFPKTAAGVRTVVIPQNYEWLLKKIKLKNPFGEYIFVSKSGKRMTTNCIRCRIVRVCQKLAIYPKSPHKARKTYGSILLDNNVDKRLILDQMGHTDIACSEIHYHRNRRNIERKSEILSNVPEFKESKAYC